MILAFIFGVLLGNATKARLYAAVCDHFTKVLKRLLKKCHSLMLENNRIKKQNGKALQN